MAGAIGRVIRQEPPCQGNRRQPETGTIHVIKLIDTWKLMKLLISSISFRTFQSFGPEPMMGSSWCGTTIGTHHYSRGTASMLLPRSFVASFQTSMPPLSPPWSIGSYWTDVFMVSYASFYYALLTCIIFLCRWRPETQSFHLPCGEMTVTLHDAVMFLSLGIRGHPVIGSAVSKGWHILVEEFLGAPPLARQGEEARCGRVSGMSLC
jgi:hypothetical protein